MIQNSDTVIAGGTLSILRRKGARKTQDIPRTEAQISICGPNPQLSQDITTLLKDFYEESLLNQVTVFAPNQFKFCVIGCAAKHRKLHNPVQDYQNDAVSAKAKRQEIERLRFEGPESRSSRADARFEDNIQNRGKLWRSVWLASEDQGHEKRRGTVHPNSDGKRKRPHRASEGKTKAENQTKLNIMSTIISWS